ncbi:MAG: tetratricopeptide repeat protein [candidate division NC10 bacterium]|nr:tetratricopeptide repeat protein [candidate division NC10 bacterium]
MKCASCEFEAPSDFIFCPRCGSKLPAVCPTCGSVCPSDFGFCPRCGTRLAAVPAGQSAGTAERGVEEADRRPVTVLFADLSGFTALSERLDPEEVRALQDELFQDMASVIERYEGFVEKFVGDAVMAVFGAPVAHEDDPERAIRAAIAMHERMAALNGRWEHRVGRPLALHIGINTGPVVAGNLGAAGGAAYAITGDTVNIASRLHTAAEPGQTLVSRGTYNLTQHAFAFEPLGELVVKGKADPLPVYRALGLLEAPRPARGLEVHGLVAPLIGREDELSQMLASLDRMRRGRAQVVSLIGEAGVGKSRLLVEFLLKLEASRQLRSTVVRRAACSSLGEHTYGIVAAFFREAYGVAPDDSLDVAQRKLRSGLKVLGAGEDEVSCVAPILGYVLGLGSGDPAHHLEPEQLKRQIFLALRTLCERRLQQGPLMLVVEDLHWADAASVELLHFLVDRLADRPLLLLLTYRPAFDASALVTSRATHTAIRLAPLPVADSDALLDAFFGPSANRLSRELRHLIIRRAGGNPFYLEEIVRSLVASGALARENDGWVCTADAGSVNVPPTIQGLLLSRLDRLPLGARRLIQEAAVLAPVFDLQVIRRVCSQQDALEANLDLLLDAELVAEVRPATDTRGSGTASEGQYRFAHALVQEVVYQNLLIRRRTELHGRVGQVLEELCGRGERPERLEDLVALGHHFSLSVEKPKGARYLVAAGDWASAIYANDDALRHYERALQVLGECGGCDGDRVAVRERLGDLLGPIGQRKAALEHYEAVRRAAEAVSDRAVQARICRKMGGLHWDGGDRERAQACFQAGLALLEGDTGHLELAHLYQEMGRLAFRSGDNQHAVEWAARALGQVDRLVIGTAGPGAATSPERREAAVAVAHAYNTLGVALARLGRLKEAVAHIERSLAMAEEHGLLQAACRGCTNLGVLYSTLDPSRAIATCLRGLEMAKRIGDLGFQSRLYANLAVAYCALTDRCEEKGIGAARAAIDLDRQLGQFDHLAIPLIVLGQIYQCHGGNPELALQCYTEALGLAEEAGEPQLLFPCYDGLATLYLEVGDEAQAEQYMRKAQEVCERAGVEPDSLLVLPFFC